MRLNETDVNRSQGADVLAPRDESELAAIIAESHASARPLRIVGGGTRVKMVETEHSRLLTTRQLSGIVTYEPGELTLIARAGTPVEEIEQMLAAERQTLAFEPMDHRSLLASKGTPTIGGVVSANVSGPRRVQVGACRDHLLGIRFVDGRGRIIKNGGRVMKNVTGLNLGKLLCGAYGALGVLTEVALKTLPMAESEQTLIFGGISVAEAVEIFLAGLSTPFEISGAAFHGGSAWLRIEGLSHQVEYRRERLTALFRHRTIDICKDEKSKALWRSLRDLRHFSDTTDAVWRIFVKPTDAPAVVTALQTLGGQVSLDWGGGLIWYCGIGDAVSVRKAAGSGQATLVRGGALCGDLIFAPERKGVAELSAALRRTFDPARIFNVGLMGSLDADKVY
ncbi:FAD-binding protein [Hyphomicrobium sp.]|uniref:FAD-binding protein n=1 Tax=Hyphomicrobium sp. TaxID=82 RepID=UPI000FA40A34|nr:FAD-binding protein [Hyphomicrobium sp.]RUP08012.1 MAG: FAD-binding protein [Hyphomicrobium sp.]